MLHRRKRQRRGARRASQYQPVLCATPAVRYGAVRGRRLLDLPLLDRVLALLLGRPYVLLALGVVLGAALIMGTLLTPHVAVPSGQVEHVAGRGARAARDERHDDAVLEVVAAYNQASITAGALGDPTLLAPFFAPESPSWQQVQAEYTRRRQRGELSDASLVRWGVLDLRIDGDVARVETQEQWDVITSLGGKVTSSRRGVLTRNVYMLRLAPTGGWRIVRVETTPLVA